MPSLAPRCCGYRRSRELDGFARSGRLQCCIDRAAIIPRIVKAQQWPLVVQYAIAEMLDLEVEVIRDRQFFGAGLAVISPPRHEGNIARELPRSVTLDAALGDGPRRNR